MNDQLNAKINEYNEMRKIYHEMDKRRIQSRQLYNNSLRLKDEILDIKHKLYLSNEK